MKEKKTNRKNKNIIFKKPYIIAEIGVNYYDIGKKEGITPFNASKLMIRKAKEGGADAVKFQSYKAEKLASKYSLSYWDTSKEPTKSQYELFKKFDKFNSNEYSELAEYCKRINIDFLSTPFDFESIEFLDESVKYFKVASADITNHPFIKKIAEKNKPILLSTGAATIEEIEEAIHIIKNVNRDSPIVLLHCVLSYPTKNEDANLYRIKHLSTIFDDCEIGYSDHTMPDENMVILTTAYLLGATVIEKHFTLDKSLHGNDHYHAMDYNDLKTFRKNLDIINEILSKNDKNYLEVEEVSRIQARRSIVPTRNLKKGEKIKEENITFKRPGTGISPKYFTKILGMTIKRDIEEDEILKWDDVY